MLQSSGILLSVFIALRHLVCVPMGIGFSIAILIFLRLTNKYNLSPVLKYTDKYSYCFYIVQQSFLTGLFSLLFITPDLWKNIILVVLASAFFGVVLQLVSDKIIQKLKNAPVKSPLPPQNDENKSNNENQTTNKE